MNDQARVRNYVRYITIIWPIIVIVVGLVIRSDTGWTLLIAILPAAVWGYATVWRADRTPARKGTSPLDPARLRQLAGPAISEEVITTMRSLNNSVAELAAVSSQVVYQVSSVLPSEESGGFTLPRNATNPRREAATILQQVKSVNETVQITQATLGQVTSHVQRARDEHNAMHTSVGEATESLRTLTEALLGAEEVVTEMNFLALNASIEAAKAAAQGQSFTIIANNISALHDQIQALVDHLRTGLNRLRIALGQTIQHAAAEADQSTSGITGIQAAMKHSNESMSKIASCEEAAVRLLMAVDEQLAEFEMTGNAIRDSRAQTAQVRSALESVCSAIPDLKVQSAEIVQQLEGLSSTP